MKTLLLSLCLAAQAASAQGPTRFALSRDGTRIAYDVTGDSSKPVLMLLHGGSQTRAVWHRRGYVDSLKREFRVVTVDQRGNGESDKPLDASAYAIDRLVADLTAVTDAVGARTLALWGFSYGATIGRYFATRTDRVESMVYIGIAFGPMIGTQIKPFIDQMQTRWKPYVDAYREGRLDIATMSAEDRLAWTRGPVPVTYAWLTAMTDYPSLEPSDMKTPTLWVVGSANPGAMAGVSFYREKLAGTKVTLRVFDGLTHAQELDRIDVVLKPQIEFSQASRPR